MAKVVVLGAGIAGHTAAAFLRKKLSKKHEVVVVPLTHIISGFPRTSGSA